MPIPLIFVLVAAATVACGAASSGGNTTTTPQTALSPTPTADAQLEIFLTYIEVVNPNLSLETEAIDKVRSACGGSGSNSAYMSNLRKLIAVIQKFDTDLSGVTVPVCLFPFDNALRAAHSKEAHGASQTIKGINARSQNLVAAGSGELNLGLGQRIQTLDLLAEAIKAGSSCPQP